MVKRRTSGFMSTSKDIRAPSLLPMYSRSPSEFSSMGVKGRKESDREGREGGE